MAQQTMEWSILQYETIQVMMEGNGQQNGMLSCWDPVELVVKQICKTNLFSR